MLLSADGLTEKERSLYVKPFWDQFEEGRKNAGKEGRAMQAMKHKPAIHAVGLRGRIKTYQAASAKPTGRLALHPKMATCQMREGVLSGSVCMKLARLLKSGRLVALLLLHHRKENPGPDIGQCANGDALAFPFRPFAVVILSRPGFLMGTRPRKLMQSIAQGFDTGIATMGFGILATFIEHWRGSSQGLQTPGFDIARCVIADFCEQSWSQTCARTRKRTEDLKVFMAQKKALNFLIIGGNLLDDWQELADQGQRQARLGPDRHFISLQLGLMQQPKDLGGCLPGCGVACLRKLGDELLQRGRLGHFQGGIGLQEQQRRALLQFAKEVERHRKVRYASGGQLIDQARLHLDQAILVAGQRFQFGNERAVWLQSSQISQFRAAMFRQQIGINPVRFGSRGVALAIHRFRVDGVDRKACLQQRRNQQPMIGFHDTGHLRFPLWARDGGQKRFQFVQPLNGMGDLADADLSTSLVNDQDVMLCIGPIYNSKPHWCSPSLEKSFLNARCPFPVALEALLSNGTSFRNLEICEARSFSISRAVWRHGPFTFCVRRFIGTSVLLVLALCREGLLLV